MLKAGEEKEEERGITLLCDNCLECEGAFQPIPSCHVLASTGQLCSVGEGGFAATVLECSIRYAVSVSQCSCTPGVSARLHP